MIGADGDGTSDQMRSKWHRTLKKLAYANSQEWPLAQLIALVCAGFELQHVITEPNRNN